MDGQGRKAWVTWRELTCLDRSLQARGDSAVGGAGCWNWVSYEDDPHFDTQRGFQIGTVANLLRDLPRAVGRAITSPSDRTPAQVLADGPP